MCQETFYQWHSLVLSHHEITWKFGYLAMQYFCSNILKIFICCMTHGNILSRFGLLFFFPLQDTKEKVCNTEGFCMLLIALTARKLKYMLQVFNVLLNNAWELHGKLTWNKNKQLHSDRFEYEV